MLRNKDIWKKARESEDYKYLREELLKNYRKYCEGKEIPLIKFSDELDFCKTGNRTRFENKYDTRRIQLSIYTLMTLIYPENEEQLHNLEDVICAICNEYSWQLSAHRSAAWFNKRDGIDLFAAETAMYLAEIKYMLTDRLNPMVCERISREIKWRILDSFDRDKHWFEDLKSNWASVCGCGVGVAFMYEWPEGFLRNRKRIDKCMENYLSGICDEGSTSEGIAYWRYGFSFFVMYHEVLRNHTYGRTDKFKNKKIMRLAEFCPSVLLDDDIFVTFSDSSENADIPLWLMCFLKKEYNIDTKPINKGRTLLREASGCIRDFLYYIPDAKTEKRMDNQTVYYEELQWFISKKPKYSFAVKGGHNGEEHNHNDIGSFIVVNNGKQILCDLGSANYDAKYFSNERYSVLNASSLGHSVPIVDGHEQRAGEEYYGKLSVDGQTVCVDMKNAYPVDIKRLERSFELSENSIRFTESFDKKLNIKERFVTEIEPVLDDGVIILDKTRISYSEGWEVKCNLQYTTKSSDVADRKVYMIDFIKTEETDIFSMNINFFE